MNRFTVRKLVTALSLSGMFAFSSHAMASAFQLWEQDAATVGNYHAGYAAAAYDASTAFYNPAGLSRFKEQQLVVSGDNIFTSFKYRGTVNVNTINAGLTPMPVTAQGGNYGLVPALHYVAPLSDIVAFGLSVDVPFGLMVNYGQQTLLRYANTTTSVRVIDISPVLSFKVNNYFSFGFGPDIQVMKGEFNSVGTMGGGISDSDGINRANDTGYGMHAGIMYELDENTRFGLSYHSQAVHHLTGTSTFRGPLAGPNNFIRSSTAKVNLTLPPYTALSAYHKINPKVAVMGSVIYTQWSTIQNLVLQNVAGLDAMSNPSTNIVVTIPQHFRNTYNVSVGADYFIADTVTLRGGLGFDQTPMQNAYRNTALPDNTRYALAIGSHIQSTPTIGFDIGWTHLFMHKAHVIPPLQVTGAQTVALNGSVTGSADVLAVQLVWDMV